MKTYSELKEEFEKKVEDLQSKCKHEDVSDWIGEYWALTHITGWQVKVCNICDKVVARKTICSDCRKELIKGVDIIKEVSGVSYCEKCALKAEAEEKERLKHFGKQWKTLADLGKCLGCKK